MEPVVVAHTDGMDRATWLDYRRQGIGGSDAAAIAGLDSHKSAIDVWLDKTGQVAEPVEDPEAEERKDWGRLLEPLVAERWSQRQGIEVVKRPVLYAHPEHEWMLANVDRETVDPEGILEVKTAGVNATLHTWTDPDEPPDNVYVQVAHYLAVTGRPVGYVAALLGGQKLVTYRVERDDAAVGHLLDIEGEFWEHVTEGTMPPADGADRTTELLQSMWRQTETEVRVLSPEHLDLVRAYDAARDQQKEAEARKKEMGNRLRQLLGPSEVGVIDGREVVRWKPTAAVDEELLALHEPEAAEEFRKKGVDVKRLRQERPDLAEKYTNPGAGHRQLTIPKGALDDE